MVTVAPPPPWAYALRLPHDPRAVRVARMTVRAVLGGHGKQDAVEAVELLTSELVTNAYRHTKGPASLRLTSLSDGWLRVGVWDSHPYIPAPFGGPPEDRVPLVSAGAEFGRGCASSRSTRTAGAGGRSGTVCWGGVRESCCGSRWAGGGARGEGRGGTRPVRPAPLTPHPPEDESNVPQRSPAATARKHFLPPFGISTPRHPPAAPWRA
ncbi:ATP-binding protein [Streptomyces sp. GD-15H]|uniref:ATP-binding protein n=1 Tax=Streptomyces sp. GD-15H TaxID=3129112 RepID=UPI003251EB64